MNNEERLTLEHLEQLATACTTIANTLERLEPYIMQLADNACTAAEKLALIADHTAHVQTIAESLEYSSAATDHLETNRRSPAGHRRRRHQKTHGRAAR